MKEVSLSNPYDVDPDRTIASERKDSDLGGNVQQLSNAEEAKAPPTALLNTAKVTFFGNSKEKIDEFRQQAELAKAQAEYAQEKEKLIKEKLEAMQQAVPSFLQIQSQIQSNLSPHLPPPLVRLINEYALGLEVLFDTMNQAVLPHLQLQSIVSSSFPQPLARSSDLCDKLRESVQECGYMSPVDANKEPVSEMTKSFWEVGLLWTITLWPHDLSKEDKGSIDESIFVNIMTEWLDSKEYRSFGIDHKLTKAQLERLFRLYTGALCPGGQLDPAAPKRMMHVVLFVQCVELMLLPNYLKRPEDRVVKLRGPLNLGCTIDSIYDALCNPKTTKWVTLFRGPVPRAVGEAAWRAYKTTEIEGEEIPLFLRLPEVSLEPEQGTYIASGLNLLMCFINTKNKFIHKMLVFDLDDQNNDARSKLLNTKGQPQNFVGEWLLDWISCLSAPQPEKPEDQKGDSEESLFKGPGF